MGNRQADGFGDIERAAAAQADHAVAIPVPVSLQSILDILLHRIGIHIFKKRRGQARPARLRQNLLGKSTRNHATVRHQERPRDSQLFCFAAQLTHSSGAKDDSGGKGES